MEMATARPTDQFRDFSVEEAARLLNTSGTGLSDAEAKSRAARVGYNEVREKARNPVSEFASRLWGQRGFCRLIIAHCLTT
jgi:magnesium-transporting ATPase (P-type)